jgi:hypothetical protein
MLVYDYHPFILNIYNNKNIDNENIDNDNIHEINALKNKIQILKDTDNALPLDKFNFNISNDGIIFYFYYNYDSKIDLQGSTPFTMYNFFCNNIIPESIKNIICYRILDDKEYFLMKNVTKDDKKYIVLLSGWRDKYVGHSINIVLEKIETAYNVYIINSGDGLNYHYKSKHMLDNIFQSPIIIKYENITSEKIEELLLLFNVFNKLDTVIK